MSFLFNFFGTSFNLLQNSIIVGNGSMNDGLLKIHLTNNVPYISMPANGNASIKRCVMNETSSMFWHRISEHISSERSKRLVNDVVIETLDFVNFGSCLD